ncbi:hypothetical protein H920_17972 [Fukomys damarensis]|uniref:Uncharacterized protein n=1 Tax=Fukomys damarensis TaxID=885580 RepID=A0A091CNT2_FUKDA|nr:hypothetical protein H920_17972 [Fukomys damarensis]
MASDEARGAEIGAVKLASNQARSTVSGETEELAFSTPAVGAYQKNHLAQSSRGMSSLCPTKPASTRSTAAVPGTAAA